MEWSTVFRQPAEGGIGRDFARPCVGTLHETGAMAMAGRSRKRDAVHEVRGRAVYAGTGNGTTHRARWRAWGLAIACLIGLPGGLSAQSEKTCPIRTHRNP